MTDQRPTEPGWMTENKALSWFSGQFWLLGSQSSAAKWDLCSDNRASINYLPALVRKPPLLMLDSSSLNWPWFISEASVFFLFGLVQQLPWQRQLASANSYIINHSFGRQPKDIRGKSSLHKKWTSFSKSVFVKSVGQAAFLYGYQWGSPETLHSSWALLTLNIKLTLMCCCRLIDGWMLWFYWLKVVVTSWCDRTKVVFLPFIFACVVEQCHWQHLPWRVKNTFLVSD